MGTLKDWERYADDEAEQPVKRVKIKKPDSQSGADKLSRAEHDKIESSHAEWKKERDAKREESENKKRDLLTIKKSAPARA